MAAPDTPDTVEPETPDDDAPTGNPAYDREHPPEERLGADPGDREAPDPEQPADIDHFSADLTGPWREEPRAGAATGVEPAPPPTDEQPLGADAEFFERGRSGTLAQQRELVDEQGTDIRMYTGEPVETDDGVVIPQQTNVGSDNMAGSGEWPSGERPDGVDDAGQESGAD